MVFQQSLLAHAPIRRRFALCAALVCCLYSFTAWSADVVDVEIDGIDDELLDNVRAFITLYQQRESADLTDARIRRLHERAPQEIRQALQPLGYYNPEINAELSRGEERWQATYRIDAGPPVTVGELNIRVVGEGADDPTLQERVEQFPLTEGDVLVHPRYEKGKSDLLRTAVDRGYLNTSLSQRQVRVYPDQNRATIDVTLATGIRYHFGQVRFANNVLDEQFLDRFVTFSPGDPFSSIELLRLQNGLYDTDYFQSVEVQALRDQSVGREVPVLVHLEPRSQHRYTAGLGYGTDTGVRGSLGYLNRRVNRRGHRFRSRLQLSEIKDQFDAGYAIPIRNPQTDRLEFTTSWVADHPDDDREEETFSLGVARTLGRSSGWLQTLYVNYRFDSYRIGNESDETELLLPGMAWTLVKADDPLYPTKGRRIGIDIRGTTPELGSNTEFLQAIVQAKYIRKVFARNRLILRAEVGTTNFGDINQLPPSLRFYAGGDQSVRGYDYRSLGPKDAEGDPVGGEQTMVGSVEYDYRFAAKWSAAVFVDAGNAFNDWDTQLERGAGFGIRWHSPVGPVRVDLAWAVSEPDTPFNWHLVIGPEL